MPSGPVADSKIGFSITGAQTMSSVCIDRLVESQRAEWEMGVRGMPPSGSASVSV